MEYLLHTSVLLAACFAYYWLVLRRETHFTLNRWVLLACLVSSLTLPLLTVPAAWSLRTAVSEVAAPSSPVETADLRADSPPAQYVISTPVGEPVPAPTPIDWFKILRWAYLIGVLIFGANFLVQLAQLLLRILRNPGHELDGFRLVEMQENEAPFSFWNRIFLNPERYDPDTFHQIVQHEQIHVRQRHSLDLLLAEAVVIFQWFNPFAWLYRRAIEHNLEYLTDAEMLRGGSDPETYQLNLVKVAVPNFPNGLVASYNQSFLEKRITMMKARKSSFRSVWKYLTLLPLLTLAVLQFNAVAQSPAPAVAQVDGLSPTPMSPPVVAVTPSGTRASINVDIDIPEIGLNIQLPEMPDMPANGRNTWSAALEGQRLCVAFASRSQETGNNWNWNTSRCFDAAQFGELPRTKLDDFSLTREAGTMNMRGIFEDSEGAGTFSFEPSASFAAMLKKAGFGTFKKRETLLLFMADVNGSYLDYIKSQGYEPNHKKLIELAIFYEDRAELEVRLAAYERLGFGKPGLDKVIELKIHGVTEAYAEEMAASGFPQLSAQNLIEGRIHGVTGEFLKTLAEAGFAKLDFERAKEMAIHGITPEYIREMSALGYDNLAPKDLIEAKIHGVDADKIAEFRRAGLTDLSLDEAKNLSIHGVDAEFVSALSSFGFADLSPKELTNAKIHGVSSELVGGLRAIGYEDLTMDEFVEARIHGVTPEWAASFREVGFRDIPFETLIQLRIHGVSPAFIEDRMKEGRTLEEYIKMRMVGL